MYIVIRAGGVGSRLWPLSRQQKPKQLHALTDERTLLQLSIDRLGDLAQPDNVYISTSAAAVSQVKIQCPHIVDEQLIVEPARRDTAAAIGLETLMIYHRDPEAIIASLGSDHQVANAVEFQNILSIAQKYITQAPDDIITIGVKPTSPDTGYGYIQSGKTLTTIDDHEIMRVERFTEKPDLTTAQKFVQAGTYLWNANMFVWRADTLLRLYEQYMPELFAGLMKIKEALGTPNQKEIIAAIYPELEQIAIDYAIIEKYDRIATIEANIGWNDIGDWKRLKDELADDEAAVVAIGDPIVISRDIKDVLVASSTPKKIIACIGVEDLLIVDTDDALLICRADRSNEVKKIVETLEADGYDHVL